MGRLAVPLLRLSRILAATLSYTSATAVRVRRAESHSRPLVQAQRQRRGCRRLCRILHLRVDVDGTVATDRPSLIVSNHFGILDPLAIASVLSVAFVGKAELRHWPLVGWVCKTFGVLFVHRGDVRRTHQFVEVVQQRLRHGVPVLAFPEGTTTRHEVPVRFKTGVFASVAGSDVDVVPVYLRVTSIDGRGVDRERRERVVWADSQIPFFRHFLDLLSIDSITMMLHIGEPIRALQMDRRQLADAARAAVAELAGREADEAPPFKS